MDKFYCKCGEFVSAEQRPGGGYRHMVRFVYQFGVAEYDGDKWTFKLD